MRRTGWTIRAAVFSAALSLAGCAALPMSEPMGTRAASTSQDTSTAALSQAAALASACSGCHRQGGQTIVDLHALTAQQLEQSLLGYKRAVDGPSVMHRMARGYSDGEIAAIAQLLGR